MGIKSTWDERAEATLAQVAEWLERWPTEQHWLDELEAARNKGFEATYELLKYAGFVEAEAKRFAQPDYKPIGAKIYSDPAMRWRSITAKKETIEEEQHSIAIFALEMQGWKHRDAMDVIIRAKCDDKQAVEMAKAGKTKDEIIAALKKNDGGSNHPSP